MRLKALFLVFLIVLLVIPVVQGEDALDWYTKGQYALGLGNYAEALTNFNNALALDKNYASALSGKAVALNGLGNYDEAVIAAEKAIVIKPSDQVALNARAFGLLKSGRYSESITAYDTLFSVGFVRADAFCNQGYAYLMLNQSENAVISYEKCTTIDPSNQDGWNQ